MARKPPKQPSRKARKILKVAKDIPPPEKRQGILSKFERHAKAMAKRRPHNPFPIIDLHGNVFYP